MRFKCVDVLRAVLGEPAKQMGQELPWHCTQHDDAESKPGYQFQKKLLDVRAVRKEWKRLGTICIPCWL